MAPCTDAMIKQTITLSPDATVKEALDLFKEHNIRNMPVVSTDGEFLGLMGLREILSNILPVAASVGMGLPSMDFIQGGAANVAKKLKKSHGDCVKDLMNKDATVIEPDSATWEALRVMVQQGSPVPVVEKKTNKFLGLISRQTLLAELDVMLEEIEKEAASE